MRLRLSVVYVFVLSVQRNAGNDASVARKTPPVERGVAVTREGNRCATPVPPEGGGTRQSLGSLLELVAQPRPGVKSTEKTQKILPRHRP